jgi:hypothetical protein
MAQPSREAIVRAVRGHALSRVSRRRKRIALAVAALSDVVQLALFPVFAEGATSPFDVALDAATAIAILAIVGFQWRLAIALLAELVPGVDLFPTWTAVVASLPAREEASPEKPGSSAPFEPGAPAPDREPAKKVSS